jgi:AraC family transcriptional regulator of adaptative response / DNA-3-methyladenine glycosylase II
VRISLPCREPHDWDALLAALADRGERVEGGVWTRALTKDVDGADGVVTVERAGPGQAAVRAEVDDLRALPGVLARVRRVFDLGCDPEAVARDLSADPLLAPLVAARPGLRAAGDWTDAARSRPATGSTCLHWNRERRVGGHGAPMPWPTCARRGSIRAA